MFTYRCPACGKQHTAADDFVSTFEARCLRCGDTIEVTAELAGAAAPIQPAAAARAGRPSRGRGQAGAGGPGAAEGMTQAGGAADDAAQPLAEDGELPPPREGDRPNKGAARKGHRRPPEKEESSGGPPGKDDRDESEEGAPDEAPAWPGPGDAAEVRRWYRRPPVLVGIAAAVLLLAGGAAGAVFLTARKAPPTKKEAARARPAPKLAAAAPTAKAPEQKPATVEAPQPRPGPDVFIAAPRLAAELTANTLRTDMNYRGKHLEVSGLFDGFGTRSRPAPARQHAFFRTDGARVSCDLSGSPTPPKAWEALRPGKPMTVRGAYDAEGVLRNAELVALTAPAEAVYRGKEVELVGYVEGVRSAEDNATAFPTVRLESETFSPLDVECLFRKTDVAEVRKVPPGALVTVRGTCAGRHRQDDKSYRVRLDNCRFVYTTAPEPPAPRLTVAPFLRAYGEDLRRDLLPPAGSEERLEAPLTVTQLARDFAADRQALEKYRGKVITVRGRLLDRTREGLLLEGDDTDKDLRVLCRCTAHNSRLLGDGPVLRVRGLCAGLAGGATLRLENCEPAEPEARRLTADYLPHVPGRLLTYDIAAWPADGRKPVLVRQNFVEAAGGLIETVTTHTGTPPGHSLFEPGGPPRWLDRPGTRKVRLPGPVYYRRESGGFVEVGQRVLTGERQVEVVWEPVLKVGARPGESWTWAYGGADHTYTLEKFEEHEGRPAAVVAERVVLNGDDAHPALVRHVYVRDVGEVERRDTLRLTRTDTRVTAEKRLVGPR